MPVAEPRPVRPRIRLPAPETMGPVHDLVSTEPDGSVQAGKDVVLSITLGGVPAGNGIRHGAMIESNGFQSQTVSLE